VKNFLKTKTGIFMIGLFVCLLAFCLFTA